MQAMKDWHKSHPHLFVKTPRNRPGRDTYPKLGVMLEKKQRSGGSGASKTDRLSGEQPNLPAIAVNAAASD